MTVRTVVSGLCHAAQRYADRFVRASATPRTRLDARVHRSRRPARVSAVLTAVGVIGLVAAVGALPPEWRWESARFAARTPRPFHPALVLVGLDDAGSSGSDAAVDGFDLAHVVDGLSQLDARVAALDVHVSADTKAPAVEALAAAVERARQRGMTVVLPVRTGGYGADRIGGRRVRVVSRPPARLDSLVATGYTEVPLLDDPSDASRLYGSNVALAAPIAVRTATGDLVASFSAVAVREWTRATQSGPWSGPFDAPGIVGEQYVPMDYAATALPPHVRYLDASDVVARADRLRSLSGSLVIVAGVSPSADVDVARTPFGVVRGGVVHLHAADTLLRRSWPTRWPGWVVFLYASALGMACVSAWFRAPWLGVVVTVAALIVVMAVGWVGATHGAFGPVAWPLRAVLAGALVGFVISAPRRASATLRATAG